MNPEASSAPGARPVPPVVWWALWAAIASGLVLMYAVLPVAEGAKGAGESLAWFPAIPLIASVVVRWVLFPRVRNTPLGLPVFVIGLSLAEGSALIGHFLVPGQRETYFAAAVFAVGQFIPLFARPGGEARR
jgi:hypothetical protein